LIAFGWLAARPPIGGRGASHKIEPFHAALVALAGGMILARGLFVALHAPYYAQRPWQALWLWQGGLSAIGAILGSLLGLALYSWLAKAPLVTLADQLSFPAGLIAMAAWAGCWADGCAYGFPLDAAQSLALGRDPFLSTTPRWPTQALGALLTAILTAAMYWFITHPAPAGLAASAFILGLSCILFGVSLFRADPSLLAWHYRLDTLASATLGVLGLGSVLACLRAKPKRRG